MNKLFPHESSQFDPQVTCQIKLKFFTPIISSTIIFCIFEIRQCRLIDFIFFNVTRTSVKLNQSVQQKTCPLDCTGSNVLTLKFLCFTHIFVNT